MDTSHDGDITVAVTTFRRPEALASGLPHVLTQVEASGYRVHLLVVDNDRSPSAREYVTALSPHIRYLHEPRPGVSAARNAALDAAAGSAALIFLDDDTRPVPGWLDAMIDLWAAHRPAAVTGSVTFTFDSAAEERTAREWGEFDDTHRSTGSRCVSAASRNLLLDPGFLMEHGIRFDERLGLVGGEDTLLTREVVAAGGRILWCDEARVIEHVPASRVDRSWILRRAYRSGGSWAYALLCTSTRAGRARWRLAARAVALMGVRAVSAGVRVTIGHRTAARHAWRDAAAQAGVLAICLGARGMREYGRAS